MLRKAIYAHEACGDEQPYQRNVYADAATPFARCAREQDTCAAAGI